eukprot:Nitzschia sp. Nitz4//scaffold174_size87051//2661//6007//NITZ4_005097-RA/size87051-augustus-gene-0.66-mRNA-1//-1//CDS//3329538836//501//frame0
MPLFSKWSKLRDCCDRHSTIVPLATFCSCACWDLGCCGCRGGHTQKEIVNMQSTSPFRRNYIDILSSSDDESDYASVHSVQEDDDSDSEDENVQPRNPNVHKANNSNQAVISLTKGLESVQIKGKSKRNNSVFLDSSDEEDDDVIQVLSPTFQRKHTPTPQKASSATKKPEDNEYDDDGSQKLDYRWKKNATRTEYTIVAKTGTTMPDCRVPNQLFKSLYDHQKEGVAWMAGLYNQGIGGLLGDDMGMGKTYQTLTLLGGLMRARTIKNALVVAPLSVLRSWEREAHKVLAQCLTSVNIQVIGSDTGKGTRQNRLYQAMTCNNARPHLVISTYGLIGSSYMDFIDEDAHWDYIVLDEAQKIKNPSAQVSKNIRRVAQPPESRRLLLTGTPIMNNLTELWALFDFVANGRLLDSAPRFKSRFQTPIEDARSKNASPHQITRGEKANADLQNILRPYMLQRLKCDYLADKLPTKTDIVVWTHLSRVQREMYTEYVTSKDNAVAGVLSGRLTSPLEAITHLKKLCGHPILVDEDEYNIEKVTALQPSELKALSTKLQVLDHVVDKLLAKQHRVLIFSQSTRMLDIIQHVFKRIDGMLRIDGTTKEKDRQRFVDNFNTKDKFRLMLLSTKAAGIGLTLTGADRAIIYDPSWNPAEDAQAIDRCYRIGQEKAVTVLRFIAAGTVEEKMYEKQVHKDGIRRAVVTSMGNSTARYFDTHELRQLFRLNDEGKCDFLDRLRERGLPCNFGGRDLFSVGAVGTSSHDVLYSEATAEPRESSAFGKSDTQQAPFASPTKGTPGFAVQPSEEPQPNKVLGKTQRALNKTLGQSSPVKPNQPNQGKAPVTLPKTKSTSAEANPEKMASILGEVDRHLEHGHAASLVHRHILKKYGYVLSKSQMVDIEERIRGIGISPEKFNDVKIHVRNFIKKGYTKQMMLSDMESRFIMSTRQKSELQEFVDTFDQHTMTDIRFTQMIRRVDDLVRSSAAPKGMKMMINTLEKYGENLDEDQKKSLHQKIATLAYKLQWL